jgi:hypothetical protein
VASASGKWRVEDGLRSAILHLPLGTRTRHWSLPLGCGWAALVRYREVLSGCPEMRKASLASSLCRLSGLTIAIFLPTIFLPFLEVANNGARIWWARIFRQSKSSLVFRLVTPCDNSGYLFSDRLVPTVYCLPRAKLVKVAFRAP